MSSRDIRRTPRTHRNGAVIEPGADVEYIATRHLRFGDAFLEPGDRVPVEPGRNYGSMLRHGDIQAVVTPTKR